MTFNQAKEKLLITLLGAILTIVTSSGWVLINYVIKMDEKINTLLTTDAVKTEQIKHIEESVSMMQKEIKGLDNRVLFLERSFLKPEELKIIQE